MLIKIPFTEDMALAVINSRKSCTTRTKRYGSIGDVFRVEYSYRFETLIITDLKHITLKQVAADYYSHEGFISPEDFIATWRELHPRAGWVPNQLVWTHFFDKE